VGRNRTYDREELLAIAMRTFWRFGYGATTFADLVAATAVDKKTLFREFESKEKLFENALQLYVENAKRRIDRTLNVEPFGLNNINAYFESLTALAKMPSCFLSKALAEFELITQQHQKIVRGALNYLESKFSQNLQAALENTELQLDTSLQQMTKHLMYSIYGIHPMSSYEGSKVNVRLVVDAIKRSLAR
jgi:AcrR family transcriptional regulator